MIFYAIRQRSTGWYMPQQRYSYGSTGTEPLPRCVPRLFKTYHAANCALHWWLLGARHKDIDGGVVLQVVPDRHNDDMEIIKVELTETQAVLKVPQKAMLRLVQTQGGGV